MKAMARLELYEALRAVRCRHAGSHGQYVPLPEAAEQGFARKLNVGRAGRKETCGGCFSLWS